MEKPIISIIIPAYNVEKYIHRCLDSILSQTFSNWECILIDDGSPDNSGKICDDYATKDSRFKVIHQKNSGVSRARNAGIDAAKGLWLTIMDSDDWIDSETLQTAYDFTLNNSAEIIQWGYYHSTETTDLDSSIYINDFSLLNMKPEEPYGSHTAMLINLDFINKNKIRYATDISMGEDWIFAFECYFKAKNVINIKEKAFYHYLQHDDSTCHKPTLKNISSQIDFVHKFEKLIAETPYKEKLEEKILIHKKGAKMNLLKTYHFKMYKKTFPEIEDIVMQEKSRFTPAIHLLHYNLDIIAFVYLFMRYRLSDIKQLLKRLLRK